MCGQRIALEYRNTLIYYGSIQGNIVGLHGAKNDNTVHNTPTVLLYGMIRHYFRGRPLNLCDIPSHFPLGERLFRCKNAAKHELIPSYDTHQLSDFTALAALLPAMTE
ncbi:hypothetical protein TNCV_4612091 [Trichonephila clavipes]|nr:hypothetical protein TNCV_4612091 [Trichonephila clavipes]